MKNYDEEAKKRREARHQEVREGFIKNLNALMYERNYSCQQLSINIGKNISYIMCVHNYQNLPCGGTHLETIQARIINYFNWYFFDEFGEKYTYEDIAKYLTIVVETRCENFATQWVNGTRKSISNRMITDMCQDMVDEDFRYYLKLHRENIIDIINQKG